MAIDKNNLIHVKEYDVYVHKTTHKVYRIDRRTSSLVEIVFHQGAKCKAFFYSNSLRGLYYLRRSRVLALALLPRPDGASHVRHKNGDVADDRLSNLEWSQPVSPKVWTDKYREQNINLSFWDPVHQCNRQRWCDKAAVAHLLRLKPKDRGTWLPEYAPKTKVKRGNRK